MVKLKTNLSFRFNTERSLPFIGNVKFDDKGIIEVPDEFVDKLIEMNIGLELVSDKKSDVDKNDIQPQVEGNDIQESIEKEGEGNIEPQVEDNDKIEVGENDKIDLSSLKKSDLIDIATEYSKKTGVSESEWKSKNKEQLIEYLNSKI